MLDDLRELSSGLHPAILSEGGLRPGVAGARAALGGSGPAPRRPRQRFEERVEVAAYYVVSEVLANTAKHAGASVVEVSVGRHDGGLRCRSATTAPAAPTRGRAPGCVGLSDRVEALGGTIAIASAPGAGTAIEVELPLPA